MSITRKEAIIAVGLTEFGDAMRGDWGSIDGRSVKAQMQKLALIILEDEGQTLSIDNLRSTLDLCPHGEGHWTQYCAEDFTPCPSEVTP